MSEHNTLHKVVVIGGGYAGTLAANRLRMRADVDVTLVNPRPKFVERIRLHQFVARTGDATIDYGTLLGEGIQLVVDSATRIDTAARIDRRPGGGGRAASRPFLVVRTMSRRLSSEYGQYTEVPSRAEREVFFLDDEDRRLMRAPPRRAHRGRPGRLHAAGAAAGRGVFRTDA
ncbi:FAD-dependent oxidoreductase [Nonomuraea sp. NPDC049400]|uniref:FAD-dependent oxidoreductase n=1 Tax=Nonomuraea sp. NPDC049400 TaxID=3364352 RepID=UPI00379A0885